MIKETDFPSKENYPKEMIKRVQAKLLDMASIVTKILDENKCQYFITFGTLLGAVRHKGFIPWDDDFDIMILDEEYEHALNALRVNLPKDLIVHDRNTDPIYWPGWSRVRDLNSSTTANLWPDDNAYKYTGINLDLYRVKRIKRGLVDLYRKREHIEFIVRKHTVGMLPDEKYNSLFNIWTSEYTALLRQNEKGANLGEDVVAFVTSDFVFLNMGDVFPLRKYQFEDCYFWGPNNYDAALTHMFGNYMELPPYEKRCLHYDKVVFAE